MAGKKKKKTDEKLPDLSKATPAQIVKAFNNRIQVLSAVGEADVDTLDTELPSLNEVLGNGGLPMGRVIEVFGVVGGGKTSLALQLAAAAQRAGGRVAYIDAEHAVDPSMAKEWFGLDPTTLLFNQPDVGEDAMNLLNDLLLAKAIDLGVVDSVPGLMPKRALDQGLGAAEIPGVRAAMMSRVMPQLVGSAHRANATLIFINQIRYKIGVSWGNPETTTGGEALRYFASVRLDVRRSAMIRRTKDGPVVGIETSVKAVKNKLAPPFASCKLKLLYGKGWKDGVVPTQR